MNATTEIKPIELFELNNSLDESLIFKPYSVAKEILENNDFKVVTFAEVKKCYLSTVKDLKTANKLHLYSPFNNLRSEDIKEIEKIYNSFERIVLKETRGAGTRKCSSSFETLNDYLRYHSGCFYNWFNPFTGESI